MAEITELLGRYQRGDPEAQDPLYDAVYHELKKLARRYMAGERRNHTLQPTALINETYRRLQSLNQIDFQNRAHFFAIAALQMNRILKDYAKSRNAKKHGGGQDFVATTFVDIPWRSTPIEVQELREILERLEKRDPRMAKIVNLRFFAGMTFEEIAAQLEITEKTVRNEWKFGRTWLLYQLDPGRSGDEP